MDDKTTGGTAGTENYAAAVEQDSSSTSKDQTFDKSEANAQDQAAPSPYPPQSVVAAQNQEPALPDYQTVLAATGANPSQVPAQPPQQLGEHPSEYLPEETTPQPGAEYATLSDPPPPYQDSGRLQQGTYIVQQQPQPGLVPLQPVPGGYPTQPGYQYPPRPVQGPGQPTYAQYPTAPRQYQDWTTSPHGTTTVVHVDTAPLVLQAPFDWRCPAILACLCCFWPLGIAAIIFAFKSRSDLEAGNYLLAIANANIARRMTILSVTLGILFLSVFCWWIFS